MAGANDTHLGKFVYCAQHVGVHTSGWCTVSNAEKLGLLSETADEARAEVRHLGLPIYGLCPVCYKWIANEPFSVCPDHTAAEYAGATRRREDLQTYLWERRTECTT